jgi:hypothetical protein
LRLLAAQQLRHLWPVDFVDLASQHGWADGLPEVRRWTTVEEAETGLVSLHEEFSQRERGGSEPGPRLLLIDDIDVLPPQLKARWSERRRRGQPAMGPAIGAWAESGSAAAASQSTPSSPPVDPTTNSGPTSPAPASSAPASPARPGTQSHPRWSRHRAPTSPTLAASTSSTPPTRNRPKPRSSGSPALRPGSWLLARSPANDSIGPRSARLRCVLSVREFWATKTNRHVDLWLPIHGLPTAQVGERVAQAGTRPHPPYTAGAPPVVLVLSARLPLGS